MEHIPQYTSVLPRWAFPWDLRSKKKKSILSTKYISIFCFKENPYSEQFASVQVHGEVWVSSCHQTMVPEHRIAPWIMHHSVVFLPCLIPSPLPKLSSPETSSPINYLYLPSICLSICLQGNSNEHTVTGQVHK